MDPYKVLDEVKFCLDKNNQHVANLTFLEKRLSRRLCDIIKNSLENMLSEIDEEMVSLELENDMGLLEGSYEPDSVTIEEEEASTSKRKSPAKTRPNQKFSYDFIKRVIEWRESYKLKHKKYPPFQSVQSRYPKVTHEKYIKRFEEYYKNEGTKQVKFEKIGEYVYEKFTSARQKGFAIHDRHLRMWALEKSKELNMPTFRASSSWISRLKTNNKISSRKITRLISKKTRENVQELQTKIDELYTIMNDEVLPYYGEDQIYNIDESGINYEVHTKRTLSHTGEKDTEVVSGTISSTTHSYTIVPMLSMSGKLVSPLFVCLKETSGIFGPRVKQTLPKLKNIRLEASKSGKLDKAKFKEAVKVIVNPNVEEKACILLDQWGGHKDSSAFNLEGKEIKIVLLPEGSTSMVQPLDVGFFRYYKDFMKQFTEMVFLQNSNINLIQRETVIKINSAIHNQFSAKAFWPLFRVGWEKAGLAREEHDSIYESLKDICFSFDSNQCSSPGCHQFPFVKCAWENCAKILCTEHFLDNNHIHI